MRNAKALLIVFPLLLGASVSCKFLKEKASKTAHDAPAIDLTTPAKGLDVKVELDKKQNATGKVGKSGGSVSLTAADGRKFTLDVPANALDAETTITLTAVKTLDGAPLDANTPAAVQLEPSGLLLKETATLTIIPGKEIPVRNQVIFGYEGDGKDYHLAPVDPKSKDVKVRLTQFSGAGVGSASDTAWAANLMIQANDTYIRLNHALGQYTQADRNATLSGRSEGDPDWQAKFAKFLEQYEDQVLRKEMVAAELDCRHAKTALHHLIGVEHDKADAGLPKGKDFRANWSKLLELGQKCHKSYHAEGSSDGASFKGDICDVTRPFTIDVDSKTGKWPMNFTPESESAGHFEGTFSSDGCTLTGGGPYTISIGEDGSGTITFTYNSTATCPYGPPRTTSRTSTLPLKPAPEGSCP